MYSTVHYYYHLVMNNYFYAPMMLSIYPQIESPSLRVE